KSTLHCSASAPQGSDAARSMRRTRFSNTGRSNMTTLPQPSQRILISEPTKVIFHRSLPQGCAFFILTISPMDKSIFSALRSRHAALDSLAVLGHHVFLGGAELVAHGIHQLFCRKVAGEFRHGAEHDHVGHLGA